MFSTETVSPLDLHLDEENPRFRVKISPSQNDIRSYMLHHENVLHLATKMVSMNTVLPGERIIIFKNGNKNIVLEGNRRTCAYQMFLNRELIPEANRNAFPQASLEFLKEISDISVDVVEDRSGAMAYLAARHIEGVRVWSSVSKWRISYECFMQGKSLQDIASYLVLSPSSIKANICNYKILLRGIENPAWTTLEKERLSPLDIKPDKLIRIFRLADTTKALGLCFDEGHNLKSNILSDDDLDKIIKILTKRAFIDNSLNTRACFVDIQDTVEPFLKSTKSVNKDEADSDANTNGSESNTGTDGTEGNTGTDGTEGNTGTDGTRSNADSGPVRTKRGNGGSKNIPYFFDGLRYGRLSREDQNTHGVARVCCEIQKISKNRLVETYPIASAFLTRALIEQSLIYYAKMHNVQATSTRIWTRIEERSNNVPQLSKIVEKYNRNLNNFIPDSNICNYFTSLFSDYNTIANPLNWVVHKPHEFVVSPDKLRDLPAQGLLHVINYLIQE